MMRRTMVMPMVIGILSILAGVYGLFFPVETSAVIYSSAKILDLHRGTRTLKTA